MKKTIIIIITLFLVISCFSKKIKIDNPPKEDKKEYKLSLIMAGDTLIHNSVYNDAYIGNDKYDFNYMFEEIKPIVQNYDLAFYNQETIIGGQELGLSTYPRFNSPWEIGDALINAGFNLVSLANNHSLDKGELGIINSNNYWKTKEVMVSGTYNSFESQNEIIIKTKNNISYSLLSYTTHTNGLKPPTGKEYLVNIYNKEKVTSDIRQLRDKVDVIIVSMHWGEEYNHRPNEEQINIANYLASLEVDIIIGHHPHVIQPITFINDTLVIYSLGNFISAQVGLNRLVGMMTSIDIIKKEINNSKIIELKNLNNILIYTYYNNFKNFKVIPYNKLDNNILFNYEEKLKPYFEIIGVYKNDS